jgi:hypothetical protein
VSDAARRLACSLGAPARAASATAFARAHLAQELELDAIEHSAAENCGQVWNQSGQMAHLRNRDPLRCVVFVRLELKLARRLFRPACKNHLNVGTIMSLIQPEHRTEFDFETGLFGDFAVQAFMDGFVNCQVPAGQVPMTRAIEHTCSAAQHQDTPALVYDRAVHANPELSFPCSHSA